MLTFTIAPPPSRLISGSAAWIIESVPNTLTSNTWRHASRSTSWNSAIGPTENALLTRPSSRPNLLLGLGTTRAQSSRRRDVTGHRDRLASLARDLVDDLRDERLGPGHADDASALLGRGERQRAAEAGTDPGHDDDLVLQDHGGSPPETFSRRGA